MNNRAKHWKLFMLFLAITMTMAVSTAALAASEEGCHYCGMKKAKFAHSWMNIEREDGSTVGVCSVHCAAVEMALNIDLPAKKITVGDYDTKEQIDAEDAYWVIGGKRMGVMTKRAKWAFSTKKGAAEFMDKNGGEPADFDEVMKATFEDMYEDTLMIQKKRKMMRRK